MRVLKKRKENKRLEIEKNEPFIRSRHFAKHAKIVRKLLKQSPENFRGTHFLFSFFPNKSVLQRSFVLFEVSSCIFCFLTQFKMFTRKLNALQYEQPFNIESKRWSFTFKRCHVVECLHFLADDTDFQKLIFWMENTKIRFYAPEDRDNLEVGAANWNSGLENVCLPHIRFSISCNPLFFCSIWKKSAIKERLPMTERRWSTFCLTLLCNTKWKIHVSMATCVSNFKALTCFLQQDLNWISPKRKSAISPKWTPAPLIWRKLTSTLRPSLMDFVNSPLC